MITAEATPVLEKAASAATAATAAEAVTIVGGQVGKVAPSQLEPVSLSSLSNQSDQSENAHSSLSSTSSTSTSPSSLSLSARDHTDDQYDDQYGEPPIKCSAVHTLERDMPDCDYSHLIAELRKLIIEYAHNNPGTFSQADLDKCSTDDWHLSRYLLRHKLNLEAAFDMLKRAMRFNHESLATSLRPEDFPEEFYLLGGLFAHGQDRKGNKMLYLRVKLHRKTPEIASVIQAFIYFNIKRLDEEARGRGISIVIDCSGGGLSNADMDTLGFIISTLKNYFPKGLSYFLVHELPWILKPFWHIAKTWVPDEHRQLIKFSDSSNILEYIDRDNLPDYLGGSGANQAVKSKVPDNCTTLEQAAKLWGIERQIMLRVVDKYRDLLPERSVKRIEDYYANQDDDDDHDDDGGDE